MATFRVNYVLHRYLQSLFLALCMLAVVIVPIFQLKTAPEGRPLNSSSDGKT